MNNDKKKWSDITILKKIKNPPKKKYNIKIVQEDPITFDGVKLQPDFGYVTIYYVPSNYIIELKSYKLCKQGSEAQPTEARGWHLAATWLLALKLKLNNSH